MTNSKPYILILPIIYMKKQVKNRLITKTAIALKLFSMVYLLVGFLIFAGMGSVDAKKTYGAHRGASLDYEENTLEAFEKALNESKYQFIEFDVQYTKDGEIVIFHENNMFRIPKNSADTTTMTYEELNDKFEFKIPKYNEVMDVLAGNKPLDIEIKSHGNLEQDKKLVDFIVADIKEKGILGEIMISSISEDVVAYIEEKYPEVKTGKISWITINSIIPIPSITQKVYDTPADYVILHGYNLHNYENLIKNKPLEKGLIFWHFTDEVYAVDAENNYNFWEY